MSVAAAGEVLADGDLAADDHSPEFLDLGLELGRDVVLVVVVRREQHAVVGEDPGVVRTAKVPALDLVEEVEDRDVDGLLGELLALGRVVPGVVAADERPARVAVPAEELDGGAVNLVVTGDAGVHAVHETGDARELLAAGGAG